MKVDGLEIVEPGLRYQFRDGHLQVTAGMDPAFENGYVLLSQALNLRAERNAAMARVKELEGMEVKLIETSGACFRVARQHQLESGEHPARLADWLDGRLKQLVELEAGQRKAVIRITQLERDLAARLLELGAIRRAASVHGFTEGDLAAWLDLKLTGNAGQLANYYQMSLEWRGEEEALKRKLAELEQKLTDLSGVRDRLAERLLPIAQQFGYQADEGELGDWLERAIRAWGERETLRIFSLAQRYRDSDPGPAGESLEQWLNDRLQLLTKLQILLQREQPSGVPSPTPWASRVNLS